MTKYRIITNGSQFKVEQFSHEKWNVVQEKIYTNLPLSLSPVVIGIKDTIFQTLEDAESYIAQFSGSNWVPVKEITIF